MPAGSSRHRQGGSAEGPSGRSLRDRLAQFDRAAAERPLVPSVPSGRSPLERLLRFGAIWRGSPPSGYLLREVELPLAIPNRDPHTSLPPEAWIRMGVTPPERRGTWIVLDTETTGLEGGTGTLVFLVGLIRWNAGRATLRQLFLPEPAGEEALLRDLLEEFESATAILSYNGKCFDIPRLRTRLRLHRLEDHRLDLPHLDLLHPTRRLTRGWLDDCRLASVETELLDIRREDDLPGSETPAVYRALLAEHRDIGLVRVFEHNARDVESLLLLGRWLADGYLRRRGLELPAHGRLALGRALLARRAVDAGRRCLEELIEEQWVPTAGARGAHEDARHDHVFQHALFELYLLKRRARAFEEAGAFLHTALDRWPDWLDAHLELAKLYEHHLGDLSRARGHVIACLRLQDRREQLGGRSQAGERGGQKLRHRLARLSRKLAAAG